MLSGVLNKELPLTTDEKRKFLLENHIAVWDVIGECDIKGSSDASIKNAKPNDLSVILDNSSVTKIFVNGKTAEKYYRQYIEKCLGIKAITLPSTSPANATFTLEKLIEAWRVIIDR